jgi:hypothetical protein
MKIQLTKEIVIKTNNIHGFEVIRTVNRLVKNPKTKKESYKDVSETWYYPKLDQTLNKAVELDCDLANSINELLERLEKINISIEKLSHTFSKGGKVFTV